MSIVVVSPHLDDAVMSVGASIHRLSEAGQQVEIVTVFAGDPANMARPSFWDAKRGAASAAEATGARRVEDAAAAALIGARTHWLPFDDSGYVAPRDPDEIWRSLAPRLRSAKIVMVPGYPMAQHDHRWISALVVERLVGATLVPYVELPYAAEPVVVAKTTLRGRTTNLTRHVFGDADFTWSASQLRPSDLAAKRAAVACYRGEVEALGFRATISKAFDRLFGREYFGTGSCPVHTLEGLR